MCINHYRTYYPQRIFPAFLINGTLVAGALSEERLASYIEEALANCEGALCE